MDTPSPITESIPQLAPDIPANAFAVDNTLMAIIALLGGLILLGGFAWLLWDARRRKRNATPPPTPEAIALAALGHLEAERLPLRASALRLSLIMRTFLAGKTQDKALYETHEEFSHRLDSLASLPKSCQYDMRCLLEELAELKYSVPAAADRPEATAGFIQRARELVQRVTADQAKEAAERAKV